MGGLTAELYSRYMACLALHVEWTSRADACGGKKEKGLISLRREITFLFAS